MARIGLFLLISFAFSWALFSGIHFVGGLNTGNPAVFAMMALAMFGPAIGALACTFLFERERWADALGLKVRFKRLLSWLPYAWGVPIILAAASVIITLLINQQPPADAAASIAAQIEAQGVKLPMPADTLLMLTLAVNLPIGIVINSLVLTFSEELGWRGWLQPKLAHLGFWKSSLLIGVIWGLWHAPIIVMGYNFPGLGIYGAALMCAFCVAITPYLAIIREGGAGAWGAGAFHGAINAVVGVSFLFLTKPEWPWNGLLGLGGLGLMLAGWIAIEAWRRKRGAVLTA